MITNYLFSALSADDTDTTAAGVLDDVRTRMGLPDLIAGDLPPFTYLSLKKLLGETTNAVDTASGFPVWAINRIKIVKLGKKFISIEEPENLPLIKIEVSDWTYDGNAQEPYRQSANVSILVQTNPKEVNSSDAYNIIQRVNSLFVVYGAQGTRVQKDLTTGVSAINGLNNLTIQWKATPVSSWDVQHAVYKAHATVIQ